MAVYRLTKDTITPLAISTFASLAIGERDDLQRMLRDKIEIIAPGTLVISEEFCDWDDSKRRIDLLAIDKDANIVVIELKRTEDGGHMDLQAVRYAAMVAEMTFEQAVRIFNDYLKLRSIGGDARTIILAFLEWKEPREEDFAKDVRIVLASAEFSKELTTAVLWLLEKGIDIRCVRLKPYGDKELTMLEVSQVVPLPEAEEYQVRVREKHQLERVARSASRENTKYSLNVNGQLFVNLPKRRVVLQVVKSIAEAGIAPETLQQDISWQYLFFKAQGHLSSQQILDAMLASGKSDPTRYFVNDSELVFFGDFTYAISNQWGPPTMEAVHKMIVRCPDCKIICEPMG